MCGPAPEIQPELSASVTSSTSRWPSSGSLTASGSKTLLLGAAGIGPLLDLQQHQVLAARGSRGRRRRRSHIADPQLARGDELAIVSKDVDFAAPLLDDQHFGGADDVPFDRQVHVARDLAAGRVDHVANLQVAVVAAS